jgi:predicted small integral membrane protein
VLSRFQHTLLLALALCALVLVIVNIVLFSTNKAAQIQLSENTQFIQQSQQIEPIYQSIIRTLAEVSTKANDKQLAQLLSVQGITFTVSEAAKPDGKEGSKADAKVVNK